MDVPSLKVAELKDELKKRGLPTTGLKKELADRLQESVDEVSNPAAAGQGEEQVGEVEALAESEVLSIKSGEENEDESAEPVTSIDQPLSSEKTPEVPPASTSTSTSNLNLNSNTDANAKTDTHATPTPQSSSSPPNPPTSSAITTDHQLQEQVLGDISYTQSDRPEGDLGEMMQVAEAEGKAEREEEERGRDGSGGEGGSGRGSKMEVEDEVMGKRKRQDEDEAEDAKRSKVNSGKEVDMDASAAPTPTAQPPNPLPHAQHPPTRAIYIDNLRRPLDVNELKELLLEHGELDEGGVKGGIWVSGVKSHVYAVFKSQESGVKAAVALHGYAFQPIAKTTLHIEFLPASIIPTLIEKEEAAWKDGRKQLSLSITNIPTGEGWEGSDRNIQVVPQKVPGANVPGRRIPGLANAPPPPMPIRAMPGITGIGGMPVIPPRNARVPVVVAPPSVVPPRNAPTGPRTTGTGPGRQELLGRPERETRGFSRTKTRPVLFYREALRK